MRSILTRRADACVLSAAARKPSLSTCVSPTCSISPHARTGRGHWNTLCADQTKTLSYHCHPASPDGVQHGLAKRGLRQPAGLLRVLAHKALHVTRHVALQPRAQLPRQLCHACLSGTHRLPVYTAHMKACLPSIAPSVHHTAGLFMPVHL